MAKNTAMRIMNQRLTRQEDYFPDELHQENKVPQFYNPTPRGLEGKIAEKLKHLKQLDQEHLKTKAKK